MHHGEFRDERLVEVYDAECPWSQDDDFFVAVVGETPAAQVLDLGCGTGRLALGLAQAGHQVTGVDPAGPSLDAARRKPGADRVTWVEGASPLLPDGAFDVVVMTSHVAQLFLTDDAWRDVLADLHRSLVPGGRLAFDTRDPDARTWERWNPDDTRRRTVLSKHEVVEAWMEVTARSGDVVSLQHHYRFSDGTTATATIDLRFRTEQEVRASLQAAGFTVDAVYGGWQRQPVGEGHGELLVVAHT